MATATGGFTVTTSGKYTFYNFTSGGSFTTSTTARQAVQILCVAGGGGGGGAANTYPDSGGGGGGGQVIVAICNLAGSQTYDIVVGSGGIGGDGVVDAMPVEGTTRPVQTATNGGVSSFIGNGSVSITSNGGGFGGSAYCSSSFASTIELYRGNSGGSSGGNSGFAFSAHPLMTVADPTFGDAIGPDVLEYTYLGNAGTQGLQSGNGGNGGSAGYVWTANGSHDVYGEGGRGAHSDLTQNTGNGGGGGIRDASSVGQSGGNGASGIVILKITHPTSYFRNEEEIFNKSEEIFSIYGEDSGIEKTGYSVKSSDIGTTYNVQKMAPATNSLNPSCFHTQVKTLNTGLSWTSSESLLRNILSVSITKNGKFAIAAGYNSTSHNYIYYSQDYGQNWVQSNSPNRNWGSVAISRNTGQYCIACVYESSSGYIWYSDDYGHTWDICESPVESIHTWHTVSISATGKYAVAGDYQGGTGGVYFSSDYGVTWTKCTSSPHAASLSMSDTGQFVVASVAVSSLLWPTGLYYSNDYGVTWNGATTSLVEIGEAGWGVTAISGSGQYAISCIRNSSTNPIPTPSIYCSSDYGMTWVKKSATSSTYPQGVGSLALVYREREWHSFSMSESGKNAIACQYNAHASSICSIFYSDDYGETWKESNSPESASWGIVALSGNGKYAIASAYSNSSGDIFFSTACDFSFGTISAISAYSDTVNQNINPAITTNGDFAIAFNGEKKLICTIDKGFTWNILTDIPGLTCVTMSRSGIIILIGDSVSLKLSTDSGANFTTVKELGTGGVWISSSVSDSGKYAVACTKVPDGSIYFSNDFCVNWFKFINSFSVGHYVPALSRDGSRLIVAGYGQNIAYSTRIGTGWTTDQVWSTAYTGNTDNQWRNVVSSLTGQFAVAVSFNSRIYVSADYGRTWAPKGRPSGFCSACISDSGQYAFVVEPSATVIVPGNIYCSNNYGNTWNKVVFTTGDLWHDVAISGDGSCAFGVGKSSISFARTNLMTTTKTDLFNVFEPLLKYKTWTAVNAGTKDWTATTMSDNGKYILTCSDGLYCSNDYGNTFTHPEPRIHPDQQQDIGTFSWTSVAMSCSGQYAIAYFNDDTDGGGNYVSHDYCVTWEFFAEGYSSHYRSVAMSAGGKFILASTFGSVHFYDGVDQVSLGFQNRVDTYDIGGASFTWPVQSALSPAETSGGYSVALSSSGQYALACFMIGGIYYSDDFCETWNVSTRIVDAITTSYTTATADGAWRYWSHITMSGNGQYAIACDLNSKKLYISTNYGADWKMIDQANLFSYFVCSSLSNTGQYACACSSDNMFYSCDFGKTWIIPAGCSNKKWSSVKVSGNGQYATGCVDGGQVYICLATNF